MNHVVSPHGGKLVNLLATEQQRREYFKEGLELKKVRVNSKEFSDIIMLATGAFSPLEGFMSKKDYESVLNDMHLNSGVLWPIPVTLSVSLDEAKNISEGQKIALVAPEKEEIIALMTVQEMYEYNKENEALAVFGTTDPEHPGVNKIYEQGKVYLAGPLTVLGEGDYPDRFPQYARPAETREIFEKKGWETIVAFQTRNPMHRSHEYLTKIALEVCDGLFLHPIVGGLKGGDIPAEVRMKCYQTLIENYYPSEKVVLKVYPMEMRYAGPKEAVLHAIIRQNFGCTHLIVGRDHAGVGDYYGPFEAHDLLSKIDKKELYIQPFFMDIAYWCKKCGSMASPRTCPHDSKDHLLISGTELREMLKRGDKPPEEFSRPEVLDILLEYYSKLNDSSK